MKPLSIVSAALLATSLLVGCASDSAAVYSQDQMRRIQTVQFGTVVAVQDVRVEGKENPLINFGGTALGGLAGSNVGRGTGAAAGAIVGAMVGGLATGAAQRNLAGKPAQEITVRLDQGGQMISLVQETDVPIRQGQRVRVISGGGTDRVLPLP